MNAIVLLFLIGVVLLAAEIFLPGVIAGIVGATALLGGSLLSFREFGAFGGTAASVIALGLLGATLYLELVVLPRTAFGRKLVVHATVDATSQPPVADAAVVIGKTATAETVLTPSGYVLIEGRRYEGFCRTGHVPKGANLQVVGVDNFRVIVQPV